MGPSDQEMLWVIRAAAGDREAFDALLQRVERPLYRYVASLVGRHDLAEDVLQEVFVRIYRKLRWLREPGLFRPWAYRIATRECFKHFRSERRRQNLPAQVEITQSDQADDKAGLLAEIAERLPELLEGLSPASRPVIVLHYLHEMTLQEAAAVLDISVGTAKSRLAYGLACLRRQWKERKK